MVNGLSLFKNPYLNQYNAGFQGGNSSVNNQQSLNPFSQNNTNEKFNPDLLNKDTSVFNLYNVDGISGANPFSGVSTAQPVSGVAPVNAQANYQNGLAPSDDLQDVYAGKYKGKPNILNQIAIA
jgi:hypothetical protein